MLLLVFCILVFTYMSYSYSAYGNKYPIKKFYNCYSRVFNKISHHSHFTLVARKQSLQLTANARRIAANGERVGRHVIRFIFLNKS